MPTRGQSAHDAVYTIHLKRRPLRALPLRMTLSNPKRHRSCSQPRNYIEQNPLPDSLAYNRHHHPVSSTSADMKKSGNPPGINRRASVHKQKTKCDRKRKRLAWLKKLIPTISVTPPCRYRRDHSNNLDTSGGAPISATGLPVIRANECIFPNDHLVQDEQDPATDQISIKSLEASDMALPETRPGSEDPTTPMDDMTIPTSAQYAYTICESDNNSQSGPPIYEQMADTSNPSTEEDLSTKGSLKSSGSGRNESVPLQRIKEASQSLVEGEAESPEMNNGKGIVEETASTSDTYSFQEPFATDLRTLTCEEIVYLLSDRPKISMDNHVNGMYEKWQDTPCCFDDFRFIKQLGYGSGGTVWQVQPLRGVHPSGDYPKDMALKIISLEELGSDALENLQCELNALHNLPKHDHIVTNVLSFQQNGHQYIGTELLRGGDLRQWLDNYDGHIPERAILMIMYQILDALDTMHANHWAHRDIKLENIMFVEPFDPYSMEKPHIKLIDFSFAAMFKKGNNTSKQRGLYGTIGYMAPQMLIGPHSPDASDMYSVGALLYRLVARKYAVVCGVKNRVIYEQCMNEDYDFSGKVWEKIDVNTIAVCKSLLRFEEMDRMRSDEALAMVDELLHRVHQIDMRDGNRETCATYSQAKPMTIDGHWDSEESYEDDHPGAHIQVHETATSKQASLHESDGNDNCPYGSSSYPYQDHW